MLRDVKHTVTDGLLGFATATGDGKSLKIGVSPIVSDTPIIITGDMDATKIKDRLGLSPLADAVMDSVQFGASRIYCLPVSATTAGELGIVSKTGDGGGSVTVDGSPTNAFSVVVKFTAQGQLNTAAFVYSIDGGNTFTDEITVPVNGEYEITGTGLKLKFTEATEEDQKPSSFLVNDSYSFTTTAPTMTNGDVLAAFTKLQKFAEEYEFIHVVGESDLDLWQAVSEAQIELRDVYHKPVFVVFEAKYPTTGDEEDEPDMMGGGDLTDWALEMEAKRKKVKNYDIQVVTAWGRLVKLDGSTQITNLAGLVCGLYAKAAVQESIGKTRTEAGFGIPKTKLLELLPAEMDNSIIELLDLAGYLTFREYDGLDDFYVYHSFFISSSRLSSETFNLSPPFPQYTTLFFRCSSVRRFYILHNACSVVSLLFMFCILMFHIPPFLSGICSNATRNLPCIDFRCISRLHTFRCSWNKYTFCNNPGAWGII